MNEGVGWAMVRVDTVKLVSVVQWNVLVIVVDGLVSRAFHAHIFSNTCQVCS